jgi:hypothetical protein
MVPSKFNRLSMTSKGTLRGSLLAGSADLRGDCQPAMLPKAMRQSAMKATSVQLSL